MRALVVYYSNSGNTQKVAEALARALDAELGEITCARYLRWYGPVAMAWDIFTGATPQVDVLVPADATYDLVLAGGPVWAARPAPPLRAFLEGRRRGGQYGAFVTCRGTDPRSPPEKAIDELRQTAGPLAATAIFSEADIRSGQFLQAVRTLADKLRIALPAGSGNGGSSAAARG